MDILCHRLFVFKGAADVPKASADENLGNFSVYKRNLNITTECIYLSVFDGLTCCLCAPPPPWTLTEEFRGWGRLWFPHQVYKCYTCSWLGGTDISAFLWTWFSLWKMFYRCFLVFVDMEASNKSILFCTTSSDWSPTDPWLLQYDGGCAVLRVECFRGNRNSQWGRQTRMSLQI